jgi:hypothetical protein
MTVLFLSFPPGFIFSNMLTKRPPSAQRKSKRPRRNFQVTVSTVWEFGTNSEAVEEVAVPSFFFVAHGDSQNLQEQERERFENLLSLTNRRSFKNIHDGSKPVWPKPMFVNSLIFIPSNDRTIVRLHSLKVF